MKNKKAKFTKLNWCDEMITTIQNNPYYQRLFTASILGLGRVPNIVEKCPDYLRQ